MRSMTSSRVLVILALVISLVIVFFLRCSEAMQEFDRHLYAFESGDQITIAWDAQSVATYYEIRVYHFEWAQEIGFPVATGRTSTNQITFVLPKGGHYEIWVRACDDTDCSDYSKSIDPAAASVQGQQRAWWIYSYIGPITGGGIE